MSLFLYLKYKFLSQNILSQRQFSLYSSKTSFSMVPLNLPFSFLAPFCSFLSFPQTPSPLSFSFFSILSFFILTSSQKAFLLLPNNSNPPSSKDAIYLWEIFSSCWTRVRARIFSLIPEVMDSVIINNLSSVALGLLLVILVLTGLYSSWVHGLIF